MDASRDLPPFFRSTGYLLLFNGTIYWCEQLLLHLPFWDVSFTEDWRNFRRNVGLLLIKQLLTSTDIARIYRKGLLQTTQRLTRGFKLLHTHWPKGGVCYWHIWMQWKWYACEAHGLFQLHWIDLHRQEEEQREDNGNIRGFKLLHAWWFKCWLWTPPFELNELIDTKKTWCVVSLTVGFIPRLFSSLDPNPTPATNHAHFYKTTKQHVPNSS